MRACIFGAGDYQGEALSLCENALIIAADGGLSYCEAYGLVPLLAIGDFDSLGRLPDGIEVLTYPVEKDDTDMALAVREAISRGADEIFLFAALGGRLDHTLANIALLRSLSREGISAYIVGEYEMLTVLKQGETVIFEGEPDGVFSLFSLSERAKLTVRGAKYPLTSDTLCADRALGVSNRFLKQQAGITVESGEVLVLWNGERASISRRICM